MSLVGEHARAIKAAIKAALDDGLILEFEVDTVRDGQFGIGLDLVQVERTRTDRGAVKVKVVDWQEVYWEEREEY